MNLIHIDVKGLSPPEPMTAILSALARLDLDDNVPRCLVVKHRRQPFPLYEKLLTAGWAYYCQVNSDDDIILYIFRKTTQQAFNVFLKGLIATTEKGCE